MLKRKRKHCTIFSEVTLPFCLLCKYNIAGCKYNKYNIGDAVEDTIESCSFV